MNMFVMEHITLTSHINLSYRILSSRLSSKHCSALLCEKNLSKSTIQQNIFPLIFAFIKRSCTLSFCRKNNFWISFMIDLYCDKLPIVYLILLFLIISHWIAGGRRNDFRMFATMDLEPKKNRKNVRVLSIVNFIYNFRQKKRMTAMYRIFITMM